MKCDCCGKFRKDSDLVMMYGEGENWLECRWCMSISDKEVYFPKENE